MAGSSSPKYYRNRTNADTTTYQQQGSLICCTIEATGFTNPGYKFVEWNGNRAGTSISYHPGDTLAEGSEVYAIWAVANDITVTKNTTSGSERWDVQYTADQAGTIDKTLYTAGTLLDRDEKVSITIPSGSATTPTASITLGSKSININSSTGVVTSTMSGSTNITPTISAGYISAGTAGTVSASGSQTLQLTTQSGATVTPTTTEQTAVSAGRYTLGAIKVAGDVNLVAGNIKTGVSIFGVNGSYNGQSINNQQKSVDPSETAQTVMPDTGYTGLSEVNVSAISSTYVGSGITRRSSTDLTASGATITAPAGYYESSASKSVSTMTLPTSTSTFPPEPGTTPQATIGRNTATRYLYIPVGYNSSAAYYTISAVANGSVTAPSTISGSSATVSTGTNTLTLSKTISVTPNVTTAGYISSGTAGNSSVSLTASVTTKGATTYHPSSSAQSISSGTYLTGAQTINAVTTSGLIAANIKDGTIVKIGDNSDDDCITSVTGTFTDSSTVSTGQTAAAAGQILSGYSAWVDGAEVQGSIATKTSSDLSVSGATVTAPAGFYSSAASASVSSMTLPTSTSTTSSGTNKATIGRSTSTRYINIPTGYNSSAAYYTISAVPNGSVTAPSSIAGTGATVSFNPQNQNITLTKDISVTPDITTVGYISSGTAGTSTVALSAQVGTVVGRTITPTTSEQTIISSGGTYYVSGAVKVGAMATGSVTAPSSISENGTFSISEEPADYPNFVKVKIAATASVTPNVTTAGYINAGTAGNSNITLYAQILQKEATTYTPTTTNQTISSGTYLTGTQTISGDANLVAGNIKKDVPIFGVTGTYEGAAELPPANGVDF